jgi:hypothetical protein
MYGSYLPIK